MTSEPVSPAEHQAPVATRFLAQPAAWVGLAAVLAAIEFVTPSVLLVSVLFPLPVALAAWHRRPLWTTVILVVMIGFAVVDELKGGDGWGVGAVFVNALARLVSFATIALVTAYASRLRHDLSDPDARPDVSPSILPSRMRSPIVWLLLTVALLVANYVTGPEVVLSVLFVFPVLLAAWHRRLAWALGLAGVLVLGRLGIELATGGDWLPWTDYLNAAFLFLLLGVVIVVADLAAFWYQEAQDQGWGSDEDSAHSGVVPEVQLPRQRPQAEHVARHRWLRVAWEAIAAAALSVTLVWAIIKSTWLTRQVSRDDPA
jgi:hypothetical protein